MAKNFHVSSKEISKQSLALQLFGDFDATSACELMDILADVVKKNDRIAINTDGLKTVNAFGLDVFVPRMGKLARRWTDIKITGRYKKYFMES
ncbi:hypothetical protein Dvar_26520 [Desulfosarcina variabilis str. Montpellier]|uniref:hypothetical protein n=1 Tax=Desulfosarcina variabilis TaxID=2300 RepID=UPI003AFA8879